MNNRSLTIYKLYPSAYRIFAGDHNMILDDSDLELLRALGWKINCMSAV